MTSLLQSVSDGYEELVASADARVSKWPLMEGPVPTFVLVVGYVLFVKLIGPVWMMDKKPYDLRYAMIVYNFGLVFLNFIGVKEMLKILLKPGSQWFCRVNDLNDPDTIWLYEMGYWFLILKFVEFADTVFFVLRKKNNQISTLHVFHHAYVPLAVWLTIKVEPGGVNYFFPLINTTVHTVMYLYYGLAALGPGVQKYLWWKKYLTTFQIVQFVSVFIYVLAHLVSSCKVSTFFIYVNSITAAVFLVMFLNFFWHAYLKDRAVKRQKNLDERKNR